MSAALHSQVSLLRASTELMHFDQGVFLNLDVYLPRYARLQKKIPGSEPLLVKLVYMQCYYAQKKLLGNTRDLKKKEERTRFHYLSFSV